MLKNIANFLSEFSIPLICGVITATIFANVDFHTYRHLLETPLLHENTKIFGHPFNFHFLINDIFMIFFFGIAAVEITQAILPGGSLNPMSKAINPLLGTLGGVVGPVGLYFVLCFILGRQDALNGWGIPTATDIALAWLIARSVFGAKHPAVSFLLLLAIADDAIGLAIIAIFYPDPTHPVQPLFLLLVAAGMLVSLLLRKFKVASFWYYLILGGSLSWSGLILSNLHPALALVFIVPFMPAATIDQGKLVENDKPREHYELFEDETEHTALVDFEHFFKYFVDFGLFGFGLANAGVPFSGIDSLTWIVLASLAVGKVIGITGFSFLGIKTGFPLPDGMNLRVLFLASLIAGIGLTVALFVAGEAFQDVTLAKSAKMGALLSGGIAILALALGPILKVEKRI